MLNLWAFSALWLGAGGNVVVVRWSVRVFIHYCGGYLGPYVREDQVLPQCQTITIHRINIARYVWQKIGNYFGPDQCISAGHVSNGTLYTIHWYW